MRNREQIYGQEAAELLRNITVYHCIRRDQLLRLYPGKEGVIENLLRYLVKQQRIFYNTDRDCYGDVPDCREDRELTAALRLHCILPALYMATVVVQEAICMFATAIPPATAMWLPIAPHGSPWALWLTGSFGISVSRHTGLLTACGVPA